MLEIVEPYRRKILSRMYEVVTGCNRNYRWKTWESLGCLWTRVSIKFASNLSILLLISKLSLDIAWQWGRTPLLED